jgi:hypothetical protein
MTANDIGRSAALRRREQPGGKIDFSMMYFAHDAFTRDLRRMEEAAAAGRTGDPAVRNGWETFKKQLHVHHLAEDEAIWPLLREKALGPEEVAVLDMMEAEHGMIDPLLDRVDAAADAESPDLGPSVKAAAAALTAHMEHEEAHALPLVETHLGPEGWKHYVKYLLKTQGLAGAAEFLPWVLDGLSAVSRAKVLGQLPAPARPLVRWVFVPRYARTPRWNTVSP